METRLVKRKAVASCLSCSICCDLLNEATTVSVCLHTFCKSCITKKITEEDISNCPQCDTYLGGDPLEKLRMDNILQKITSTIFPSNSYEQNVYVETKLTSQSLNANVTSKSNIKKDKLSNASRHFAESATVKELHKQVKEIGSRDHQNPSDVLVTGQGVDSRTYSRGPCPIWFSLISASETNGSPPLPQIPLCYLNTKVTNARNGNAPVQLIKKYLARKLNLSSEAELEITLVGQVMGDHCRVKDLLQLWLTTRTQAKRIGDDSAKDAVMQLVYARKA